MKKQKNLPVKQILLTLLVLTGGCLLVYTSWKIREMPKTESAPGDYSLAGTDSVPEDVSGPDPADSVSTPVGAYPSAEKRETAADASNHFQLYVEQGELMVFDQVQSESYSTGLSYELLPESLQQEIAGGKSFDTEEALLEFLENYSS